MPGHRRARASLWTHKKSHSGRHELPDEPDAATWAALERAGSFIVSDKTGGEHKFTLNDVATILLPGRQSKGMQTNQCWMGKIKEIRAAPNGEVWIRINWYYSAQDVTDQAPAFDGSHCSERERIYSHHSEVVPALTVGELITMHDFLEDDPNQNPIPPDQFFCRYFFDPYTAPKIFSYAASVPAYSPTPGARAKSNTCICNEPYRPDDTDFLRVMHWCPRPQCRKAYHITCLLESGYNTLVGAQSAVLCARLKSSPDTQEAVALPDARTMMQLPAKLACLAGQPMVRGGIHGIAGNIGVVAHARHLVYSALHDGSDLALLLEGWEEELNFAAWEDGIVEPNLGFSEDDEDPNISQEGGHGVVAMLVCPSCAGAL